MNLKDAKIYAAKLDPEWVCKSDDTWLRWLKKRQDEEEPHLLSRTTPGKKGKWVVRKSPLDRLLGDEKAENDARFATIMCRLDLLEERVNSLALRQIAAKSPQKNSSK